MLIQLIPCYLSHACLKIMEGLGPRSLQKDVEIRNGGIFIKIPDLVKILMKNHEFSPIFSHIIFLPFFSKRWLVN